MNGEVVRRRARFETIAGKGRISSKNVKPMDRKISLVENPPNVLDDVDFCDGKRRRATENGPIKEFPERFRISVTFLRNLERQKAGPRERKTNVRKRTERFRFENLLGTELAGRKKKTGLRHGKEPDILQDDVAKW